MHKDPLQPIPNMSQDNFLCAVSGVKDLQSDEVYIKVKISPSTEVTEGDGVKLTCSTSCPLTNNKNYICRPSAGGSPYMGLVLLKVNHGPVHEEITDQPTEENGIYYSSICFPQTDVDPLDSMVQPHQH
ncbi:hypothetical protein D4764_0186630 [Takifugu flavidus]|uniref:Uncharacterized protein n=1 Tax=Takifugu flavidus TaxID=433684 RepID=A0A5C6MIU1_9TELE|nr:hypothetical protein D4764_0186630 [Takifugu flavidus]